MSRSTDGYCGGGPNTRHREAAFIRCTVKMYNHVLSAWLFLSAPIRGAAQGHIIQIKYIYIYTHISTYPHICIPTQAMEPCLFACMIVPLPAPVLDPAGPGSGSSSGCPSVYGRPCSVSSQTASPRWLGAFTCQRSDVSRAGPGWAGEVRFLWPCGPRGLESGGRRLESLEA